jgi:hypothetical protein
VALVSLGSAGEPGFFADVAQLVEHLICNQAVVGSSPTVSSSDLDVSKRVAGIGQATGGVAEWLMAADCKSAGLTPYVGSNPTPTICWRGMRPLRV